MAKVHHRRQIVALQSNGEPARIGDAAEHRRFRLFAPAQPDQDQDINLAGFKVVSELSSTQEVYSKIGLIRDRHLRNTV
jgi:hypothetical protein